MDARTVQVTGGTAVLRATVLARAGHLGAAAELLVPHAAGAAPFPPALDLLARINVRQGRRSEARALWSQAMELDPENARYRGALDRLDALGRRPFWMASPVGSVVAVLVLLIPLAAWLVRGATDKAEAPPGMVDVPAESAPSSREAAVDEPPQAAMTQGIVDALEGLAGVAVDPLPEGIRVTLARGLYTEGVRMDPRGAAVLTRVGYALEPWSGQIEVQLVGHTDQIPMRPGARYRDNFALGAARAVAALEHLRTTTNLPGGILVARSAGAAAPPHPDQGIVNRTVVLVVRPLPAGDRGGTA